MTRWLVGLPLAAALALAGASCGGGNSALSKQDFIAKADAICAIAHSAEQKISFPQADPSTATNAQLEASGAAIDKAIDVDRQEIKDLKKLKPPQDFQSTFDDALSELGASLDHAGRAAVEARKHDGAGVTRELGIANTSSKSANAKAVAYGLKVCGGS